MLVRRLLVSIIFLYLEMPPRITGFHSLPTKRQSLSSRYVNFLVTDLIEHLEY